MEKELLAIRSAGVAIEPLGIISGTESGGH